MLQTEQLRAFLLEYLKAVVNRRDQLQYASCLSGVEHIAKERCPDQLADGAGFSDKDGARLKHVIWDLILERVLVPSTNQPRSSNDGWPFLSIPKRSHHCVSRNRRPEPLAKGLEHLAFISHPPPAISPPGRSWPSAKRISGLWNLQLQLARPAIEGFWLEWVVVGPSAC
jgi:hypothetical protein